MPGSTFAPNDYRFGYNGKENDNEIIGSGIMQDYGLRNYDTRIARFLSVDPLSKKFPWYSTFQFAGNNPILYIDLDGAEPYGPLFPGAGSSHFRYNYTMIPGTRLAFKTITAFDVDQNSLQSALRTNAMNNGLGVLVNLAGNQQPRLWGFVDGPSPQVTTTTISPINTSTTFSGRDDRTTPKMPSRRNIMIPAGNVINASLTHDSNTPEANQFGVFNTATGAQLLNIPMAANNAPIVTPVMGLVGGTQITITQTPLVAGSITDLWDYTFQVTTQVNAIARRVVQLGGLVVSSPGIPVTPPPQINRNVVTAPVNAPPVVTPVTIGN